MMKVLRCLLLFFILLSSDLSAQQYWEDQFWMKQVRERHSKNESGAGTCRDYYSANRIKWEGTCLENGRPEGIWVYYDEHGHKSWEGSYSGQVVIYGHEDPRDEFSPVDTLAVGTYRNGQKHGQWILYDVGRKTIRQRGYFTDGKPSGKWETFAGPENMQKSLSETYDYETGELKQYREEEVINKTVIDPSLYKNQNSQKFTPGPYVKQTTELEFGMAALFLDFNKLNGVFRTDNKKPLSSDLYGVRLCLTNKRFHKLFAGWGYTYFFPISARMNDSTTLRFNSWNMEISGGYDLIDSRHFDVQPCMIVGFQQMKAHVDHEETTRNLAKPFTAGGGMTFKNPGFFLRPALQINMSARRVGLALNGGYQLDCSSPRWYDRTELLVDSPETRMTGLYLSGSLYFFLN
jgi:antitoxin component YwqK of YwqJK toxin-antitoxin module